MSTEAREQQVLERIEAFRRRRPRLTDEIVTLAHGAGGKSSAALVDAVFIEAFANDTLSSLSDAARLDLPSGDRLAFSTDSFVVRPRFFPGGSIGHLAVHGTVNDVAMMGARPTWLSSAFVIEEGFAVTELRDIVADMADAARTAGVTIVAGDTKVVDRGAADGVYITTAGVGVLPTGRDLGPEHVQPGDVVLVSGTIGDHGMAVMLARGDLAIEADIRSDTAPLGDLVETLLAAAPSTRWLRDPTRGGLGTVCNELAQATNLAVVLDEPTIPVDPAVTAACDLLGIDPLYVANEGKLVAVVAPDEADAALAALRAHPLGRAAAAIGSINADHERIVVLLTTFGGTRIVDMLVGDPLPRDLLTVRRQIRVTGTVQGVGFRPFVYRHATRLGLGGWVQNDSAGVLIEVEGEEGAVLEVSRLLVDDPPPLARIGTITATPVPVEGDTAFAIVESDDEGAPTAAVSVDTATCAACLAEIDDPSDRRYRYPFTNCTDCGPRYTIVRSVPYDRPGTTMAGFTMCVECRAEYDDPLDRRFHAQPNACPECGPRLQWGDLESDAALDAAVAALREGAIVAVKGIGGFHLAVDAGNEEAVGELRRRKARDDKPFAVMARDLAEARGLCTLSEAAVEALTSAGRPIVIAPRRGDAPVASGVAPDLPELGVLLAYSPLHHLLLRGVGRPLVMTSGNVSDEPIAHEDADATERLAALVDGVLGHDRGIHIRCDDSVVRATSAGRTQVLRRSRGFAPQPLPMVVPAGRSILAVGAELKSTVAVTVGTDVVASHHIGDLEHLATYRSFLQAIDHLCALYAVTPEVVAHDLHPEYLSSKLAADLDLPSIGVQHHHAHVASCLTEHSRAGPVLALAFDGLGYGTDGTLWGGEFLVADLRGFERVGHLAPVTMPGGVAAILEPWRMAVAWAQRAGVDVTFDDRRCDGVRELALRGQGPVTTSVGRLFDAVAALLGLRPRVTYEAQAAIELEAMARSVPRAEALAFPVDVDRDESGATVLDPSPLIVELVAGRARGTSVPVLAASFHESIGRAAALAGVDLAREHGMQTVALTGGVFQNPRLSDVVEEHLALAGLEVLVHRVIPPNDGGISIGQAAVAAAIV